MMTSSKQFKQEIIPFLCNFLLKMLVEGACSNSSYQTHYTLPEKPGEKNTTGQHLCWAEAKVLNNESIIKLNLKPHEIVTQQDLE